MSIKRPDKMHAVTGVACRCSFPGSGILPRKAVWGGTRHKLLAKRHGADLASRRCRVPVRGALCEIPVLCCLSGAASVEIPGGVRPSPPRERLLKRGRCGSALTCLQLDLLLSELLWRLLIYASMAQTIYVRQSTYDSLARVEIDFRSPSYTRDFCLPPTFRSPRIF